jgi:helix-turn-helix protein
LIKGITGFRDFSQAKDMRKRIRHYSVPAEYMVENRLTQDEILSGEYLKDRFSAKELPREAKLVGRFIDFQRDVLVYRFLHSSFYDVPEGHAIENFNVVSYEVLLVV